MCYSQWKIVVIGIVKCLDAPCSVSEQYIWLAGAVSVSEHVSSSAQHSFIIDGVTPHSSGAIAPCCDTTPILQQESEYNASSEIGHILLKDNPRAHFANSETSL